MKISIFPYILCFLILIQFKVSDCQSVSSLAPISFCEENPGRKTFDNFTILEDNASSYSSGVEIRYTLYLEEGCEGTDDSNGQFIFVDTNNVKINFPNEFDNSTDVNTDDNLYIAKDQNTILIIFTPTSTDHLDNVLIENLKIQWRGDNPNTCAKLILESSSTSIEISRIYRTRIEGTIKLMDTVCMGDNVEVKAEFLQTESNYTYQWKKNGEPLLECTSQDCMIEQVYDNDSLSVAIEEINSGCDGEIEGKIAVSENNLHPIPDLIFTSNLRSICAEVSKNPSLLWSNPYFINQEGNNSDSLQFFWGNIPINDKVNDTDICDSLPPPIPLFILPPFFNPIQNVPIRPIMAQKISDEGCIARDTLNEESSIDAPNNFYFICPNTELEYPIDISESILQIVNNFNFNYHYLYNPQKGEPFLPNTQTDISSEIRNRFFLTLRKDLVKRNPFDQDFTFKKFSRNGEDFFRLDKPKPPSGSYFLVLTYAHNEDTLEVDHLPFNISTNDVKTQIIWDGICEGQGIVLRNASAEQLVGNGLSYTAEWELFKAGQLEKDSIVTFSGFNANQKYIWEISEPLSPGIYEARLSISEIDGKVCIEADTQKLYIQPILRLNPDDPFPYKEEFEERPDYETGRNLWVPDGKNGLYSWEHQNFISEDTINLSSSFRWQTESIKPREQSFIVGPCLDIENLTRPMISAKIAGRLNPETDGVVLQIAAISDVTNQIVWETLGSSQLNGINGYNSRKLDGAPGGGGDEKFIASNPQKVGWSGNISTKNTPWHEIGFSLNQYRGKTIIPRFVLGSSLSTPDNFYFAFDSLVVRNRSQNVVYEYFTDLRSPAIDTAISPLDYKLIQVPTSFLPGMNSFYSHNPSLFEARSLFYGNDGPSPASTLDGFNPTSLIQRNFQFYSDSNIPLDISPSNGINLRSLEQPKLKIQAPIISGNVPNYVDLILTAQEKLNAEVIATTIVLAHKWDSLEHVLLDILPDAGGQYRALDLAPGQQEVISLPLKLSGETVSKISTQNIDSLELLILVQDINSREIYQSHYLANFPLSSFSSRQAPFEPEGFPTQQIHVYPIPTRSKLFIEGKDLEEQEINWKIFDTKGRLIYSGKNTLNNTKETIDISSFSTGLYDLVISGEKLTHHKRILILK